MLTLKSRNKSFDLIAFLSESLIKGVLEPLHQLQTSGKTPSGVCIIVIDALCEAEMFRPDYGDTLATFIAKHISSFPVWLKIVATVRSNMMESCRILPFHKIR